MMAKAQKCNRKFSKDFSKDSVKYSDWVLCLLENLAVPLQAEF